MHIIETAIEGLVILEPRIFGDERGYFFESFSEEWFRKNVCDTYFLQDNESKSRYGVVRGLHFQKPPFEQAKLVRVVQGKVLDIAVDIRQKSPTFGRHVAIELSEENKRMLFIPKGFAHGFAILSESAIFQYKCDNYYHPASEGGILWNDSDLNIHWRLPAEEIILSEKDKRNARWQELCHPTRII